MIPILVPSLLPGIALVYMFGKQGFLTPLLMGHSIYGPIGIVIGSVFFSFPHAFIIIATALSCRMRGCMRPRSPSRPARGSAFSPSRCRARAMA
jgi:hypothetical protein